MNHLEPQNSRENIERLRAASSLYGEAKHVKALQIVLSVFGPVAFAITLFINPDVKAWGVLYALVISLVDALMLEPYLSRLQTMGARIQEAFDRSLFGYGQRTLQVGQSVPPEELAEAVSCYRGDDSTLRDWYPSEAGTVPLAQAALICQRINVWWDAEVRKKYAGWLVVLLAVIAAVIATLGLARDSSLSYLITSVAAPLVPVVQWCVREARKNLDAAKRLQALKGTIAERWNAALNARGTENEVPDDIQSLIFDGRSRNPLVFNWVHRRFRPRGQETMAAIAKRLVAEATDYASIRYPIGPLGRHQ